MLVCFFPLWRWYSGECSFEDFDKDTRGHCEGPSRLSFCTFISSFFCLFFVCDFAFSCILLSRPSSECITIILSSRVQRHQSHFIRKDGEEKKKRGKKRMQSKNKRRGKEKVEISKSWKNKRKTGQQTPGQLRAGVRSLETSLRSSIRLDIFVRRAQSA